MPEPAQCTWRAFRPHCARAGSGQRFRAGFSGCATRTSPASAAAAHRARGRHRRSHRSDSGSLHVHTLARENFFALLGSSANDRTRGAETQSVTPDQTAPLFRPPRTELPRPVAACQHGPGEMAPVRCSEPHEPRVQAERTCRSLPRRRISAARPLRPAPAARRQPAPENACRRRGRPFDWRGASARPSPPRSAA